MKNIKFSRSQILRTIRAACIALFFAASAGRAVAVPHFTSDFVLSPDLTTVTVAGSADNPTAAYFVDLAPNAYAFTILSGANIGNTTDAGAGFGTDGNLITFDHGSVNNAGTLTSSHYTIAITSATATSTVTNSGLITSTSGYGIQILGNGTVNNAFGATISSSTVSGSDSAIKIFGNGTVNNAGAISGAYDGVHIVGNGTVNNASTGMISTSGTYSGIQIEGDGTVNNAGTISGYYAGVYIGGAGGMSSVTNAASGTITGTSTSDYSAGVGFGSTDPSEGTSSFSLVNYGTITGSASYYGAVRGYGVTASSYSGNINISNGGGGVITGTATISGDYTATGYGISASSIQGNITVTNNGMATGMASGTGSGYYSTTGYGISATSDSGYVSVTNNGTATGTASGGTATGYGINASSEEGTVTVINNGTATGTGSGSGYDPGTGYGISATSNSGYVSVTNNGTATGTGSGYYTGIGYGLYATTNSGTISITNNGTATGMGTATSDNAIPTGTGYGIYAVTDGGDITITNNNTATGIGTATSDNAIPAGTGYGISASSTYGTATIINNGTATGTGSGYYTGIGYGLYATTDSGTISITNNKIATGMGTASGSYNSATGTGYGIYASSESGYIQIFNNCAATGTGTATAAGEGQGGGSASGYGYGIFADSKSGNIAIQNCGQATGTGSGYYNATGAGIFAHSTAGGTITIVNDGLATGSASAYGRFSEPGPFLVAGLQFPVPGGAVLAYGIYAQSDGSIFINNLCNASGTATVGSFLNIEEGPPFPTATAIAAGINVVSAGSGPILINNSGTASGTASSYGLGSAYGIGINVNNTGSASVTINNSGNVFGSGGSFGTLGSGYGIYIGNPIEGNIDAGPIAITNQISGVISGSGYTGPGTASSYGIYLANGTGTATITNKGVIAAGTNSVYTPVPGIGIFAPNYTGPVTINEIGGAITTGSNAYIPLGPDSILLGGGVDTVNMVGQVNNTGLVDGGSSGENTLTMQLAGMTPTQKANLIAAVAATQNGSASGPIFAGGVTYSWVDFNSVSGSFVSLEQAVDPGLMDVATKIDNLPSYLGVAYGPLYVAAASNPEAALNSLVGREFDDALGVISKNDATALSEVFDSRAFDLRTGTGGFDLSGLDIMSSSMIASLGQTQNMLDRLMGNSALGGTTMSDSKEVVTPVANTNRWGAWASGTVTLADESSSASGQSFNYTTGSPSIGADYRVCNDLAIGALLNFSTTGANFDDGSRLGVQTGLAALYATWSDGPWYVNALGGGGISSYDNRRVTLTGDTATSSPDGDEFLGNLTGGYDFKLGGGWKISPEGGFLYTHVTENGYTESGASAFDLTLPDQNIDSLRSKLGFRILDNFSWDGIAFTPQIRASWYHEILDDSRDVTTSLGGAPALGSFTVQTNEEGRDFADLGAGLSATPAELSGDVTFFVNYDAQVGQDNFVAHTVNGGLRVNF